MQFCSLGTGSASHLVPFPSIIYNQGVCSQRGVRKNDDSYQLTQNITQNMKCVYFLQSSPSKMRVDLFCTVLFGEHWILFIGKLVYK